ncbi:hypothetical protein Pelo_9173 [Pelomyxa schiedti]|nr:hypothetical protein Pelo_9173 [Pelomyxa schiedti]
MVSIVSTWFTHNLPRYKPNTSQNRTVKYTSKCQIIPQKLLHSNGACRLDMDLATSPIGCHFFRLQKHELLSTNMRPI